MITPFARHARLAECAIAALALAAPLSAQSLDPLLAERAKLTHGSSRVVVIAADKSSKAEALAALKKQNGRLRTSLALANAFTADLPNGEILKLAAHWSIGHLAFDRPVAATTEWTGATVGATAVRADLGYDGSGVGVAVIDSGVTAWHDDLSGAGSAQRVDAFVDFVDGRTAPSDDYGHGTHVAGIVAGNGFDSSGARTGIAPGAHLVSLKVLDESGRGRISDVIAALDWVVEHRAEFNIRVVNLSIATGVYESYDADPLTLAAKRAVAAGVVVVAAAGNFGRSGGRMMYGGITAPGNAPWVLTVGASSHMGTADRADDTMAPFSSRGPTAIDGAAKPDLVAPGIGIESLSDPLSAMYTTQAPYLLPGTVPTPYLPYLAQSGTSMSAPVVAGTVALMLQANPALTPNAIKAILQYTAQDYAANDPLTEGAGFLNAQGAVTLASYFANPIGPYPSSPDWSRRIIWANRASSGGRIAAAASAWGPDVVWGSVKTPSGARPQWGTICAASGCEDGAASAWQLICRDPKCKHGPFSNGTERNIVWGARCAGADCPGPWAVNLFATAADGDTVVWGTTGDGDTVVWGTGLFDTVVWGTVGDGDTVVWGTIWRP